MVHKWVSEWVSKSRHQCVWHCLRIPTLHTCRDQNAVSPAALQPAPSSRNQRDSVVLWNHTWVAEVRGHSKAHTWHQQLQRIPVSIKNQKSTQESVRTVNNGQAIISASTCPWQSSPLTLPQEPSPPISVLPCTKFYQPMLNSIVYNTGYPGALLPWISGVVNPSKPSPPLDYCAKIGWKTIPAGYLPTVGTV